MFEVRNYKVLNNKALNFFVKYYKLKLLQYISLNFDVGKDFVVTKVANVTAGTFFCLSNSLHKTYLIQKCRRHL